MRPPIRSARRAPIAVSLAFALAGCTDFGALTAQYEASVPIDLGAPPDLESTPDSLAPADLMSTCMDGTKDGDETDRDCGGSCAPCDVGKQCKTAGDCTTAACSGALCVLATGPPGWLPAAPLPVAHFEMASALFSDGQIYSLGGYANGAIVADVLSYSSTNDTWSTGVSLPTARSLHGAAAIQNGAIYVIGGLSVTALATVDQFSVATGWTSAPPLAAARYGLAATVGPDGKLYAIGGNVYSAVESYTPGAAAWVKVTDLTAKRYLGAAATGVDGRVYAIGGNDGTVVVDTVEALLPAAGTWSSVASMKTPRNFHAAAAAPDGRIYAIGGADATTYLYSVEAYTPAANAWTTVASLKAARWAHAASVGADGRIYVIGGANVNGVIVGVEAYGPVARVSPSSDVPGMTIMVSGSNFAAHANVSVRFGDPAGAVLATGTTDSKGVLAAMPLVIPATQPSGPTRVYFVDDRSRYPVSAAFTVN
ncbi:MAG TPA: kelch repeat-containing protein [Polyangia bacterium]|nr:kelch repeat-containing protein [Polyangia bacterium]